MRTAVVDVNKKDHANIIDYVLKNDLKNHAVIISDGKIVSKELPSHGKMNIKTHNNKVVSVGEESSELF